MKQWASTVLAASRAFAAVLACLPVLASAFPPTVQAAGDDPHWTIEMPVDAPTSVGNPFVLHLTFRLVGPPVGSFLSNGASATYSLTVVRPDGTRWVVYDHANVQANAVGSVQRIPTSVWPKQNGEWIFRVEQFVQDTAVVVAEPHVYTDRADEAVAPATSEPQVVRGLRVDPPQPVMGQPATIVIEMANQPLATIIRQVPVELIDDDGIQQLGTIANPGAGGTATLLWVPQQTTEHGVVRVADQSTDIVVLDTAAASTGADASAAAGAADGDSDGGPDQ